MDSETLRWAIGLGSGGLGVLLVGIGWLIRSAYKIGGTLTRIDDRLGFHGEVLDKHAERHDSHDQRLRDVEAGLAKHSGQWAAKR